MVYNLFNLVIVSVHMHLQKLLLFPNNDINTVCQER